MRVSIIGCGYVGLVSGVCLAEKGHAVVCVDIDQLKVDRINRGEPPIHESGLEQMLRRNLQRGFRATTKLRDAVIESDLTIIAVGTPFAGDEIDLRFIKEAASQVGAVLKEKSAYHVVLVKSTVVPGTTDDVVTPLLEIASGKRAGQDFGIGMNPEFLREGEAVSDFLSPDRIVLGAIDDQSAGVLEALYEAFRDVDKIRTNPRTAETIKYAANSLLATMVSFSNEIGNLCSAIGDVDVVDVMRGVHLDKRLSPLLPNGERITPAFTTYLESGCGFGGSCFPKDVQALITYAQRIGNPMRILSAVMDVNVAQPRTVLTLLEKYFPVLEGVRVTILGLAFKPGTNDMRESPAIPIVEELLAQKAVVKAFDPVAKTEAEKIFGDNNLTFASTLPDAIEGAEAVILLTCWPEFKELPHLFSALPEQPLLIDGRRMIEKSSVLKYEGIGLSTSGRPGFSHPAFTRRRKPQQLVTVAFEPTFMKQPTCRFCGASLTHVLCDLGMSPLANSYVRFEDAGKAEKIYPLKVWVCGQCLLCQLEEFESPDAIFTDYPYFSSFSTSWVEHARRYCEMMVERFHFDATSHIIEIASNDGYLLQHFKAKGIPVLGVEPAANVAKVAWEQKQIPSVVKFFGVKTAKELVADGKSADLLLGNNVLAHVPDINDFVGGLKLALKPTGVITFEFPHLLRLIEQNQFDTVYHEHFSYLSFLAVEKIFAHHGLTLFDVEEIPTHGGSLRIFGRHAENESALAAVTDRVATMKVKEEAFGIRKMATYTDFAEKVRATKRKLLKFLTQAGDEGKKVAAYGAAAKGVTLMNYCGVRDDLVDYVVDKSPYKQSHFMPGVRIPIYSPEKIFETKPDYVLILPWNLKEEISAEMARVREWGGWFVVPIPEVQILA